MNFCKSCDSLLVLCVNDDQQLIGKCNSCPYFEIKQNPLVSRTYYRQTRSNPKYTYQFQKDVTLPSRISKCPQCKKESMNKYQKIYQNKKFFVQNICGSCCKVF